MTENEFIKEAEKTHPYDNYSYNNLNYTCLSNKVDVICKKHGVFHPNAHVFLKKKTKCPECNRLSKYDDTISFIKKVEDKHPNQFTYSKVNYKSSKENVIITCKLHGDFKISPSSCLSGRGCPKCTKARRWKKITKKLLNNFRKIYKDKYNYSNSIFKSYKEKISVVCYKHGIFNVSISNHILGVGCPECARLNKRMSIEDFKNKANKKHNNKYGYKQTILGNTLKEKITIECSIHGVFRQVASSHLQGIGCPKCRRSKGEVKTAKFLESIYIIYKEQYNIKGFKYRYDFYLPKLNILIEYDGEQHYKPMRYSEDKQKNLDKFRQVKFRDKTKNELADLNNIPLIRIPYTQYDNLEDYLLFKLSKLYRYKVKNKFYKNFIELCKGEQLPGSTNQKDVKEYLTYKKDRNV